MNRRRKPEWRRCGRASHEAGIPYWVAENPSGAKYITPSLRPYIDSFRRFKTCCRRTRLKTMTDGTARCWIVPEKLPQRAKTAIRVPLIPASLTPSETSVKATPIVADDARWRTFPAPFTGHCINKYHLLSFRLMTPLEKPPMRQNPASTCPKKMPLPERVNQSATHEDNKSYDHI